MDGFLELLDGWPDDSHVRWRDGVSDIDGEAD